jgi:hypothetical protein
MPLKFIKISSLLVLLFTAFTAFASISDQPPAYSKQSILGVWEVSSLKLNGFTSFGKEFSQTRGEVYRLVFSKTNKVKNENTGTVYNYEVVNGELKIYQLSKYGDNYKIKNPHRYDVWKFSGDFGSCTVSKVVTKKIPGYYRKEGYKWCQVEDYPQPIQANETDYHF